MNKKFKNARQIVLAAYRMCRDYIDLNECELPVALLKLLQDVDDFYLEKDLE